jgi:hypothetical protein
MALGMITPVDVPIAVNLSEVIVCILAITIHIIMNSRADGKTL